MKKFWLIILFVSCSKLFAQYDFAAGMGIGFLNNSSLQDYVNGLPLSDQLGTFNSSFEVYVESDYTVSQNFQVGLEYVYSIFSITTPFGGIGQYDLTYSNHKPSLLAYYVISGNGYKFKFGGGAGMRFVDLDEKFQTTINYTSSGFGVLGRIQAHTKLSGNFYANIGSTVRYDIGGEPESKNGNKIIDVAVREPVSINSISFSVNIGVSYFIGN